MNAGGTRRRRDPPDSNGIASAFAAARKRVDEPLRQRAERARDGLFGTAEDAPQRRLEDHPVEFDAVGDSSDDARGQSADDPTDEEDHQRADDPREERDQLRDRVL